MFLSAISALYIAMSVGPSVCVNKFQEVLIALIVHVLIMFECSLGIICLLHIMHDTVLAVIAAPYLKRVSKLQCILYNA